MTEDESKFLSEMRDREAIRENAMRYFRALDRKDYDALDEAFWPEATDNHTIYSGDIPGFIAWVKENGRNMVSTMHFAGNMLIDFISPTEAFVETYVIAYHDMITDGVRQDFIMGGRNLDRMEKRGEEWRVIRREVAYDFQIRAQPSADWRGMLEGTSGRGGCKPDDPLYRLHPAGVNA